jgi:hypothetical protein
MSNVKANKQDFELESGLPDDFDAQVASAIFGFIPEYQDGKVPLLLLNLEGKEIEPTTVTFSIGADWNITDGGHKVEHSKGKKRFVATSMIGRLIDRVVNQMGVAMWEKGFPNEADIWTGLAFHWKREEFSFGKGILEEKGGKTTHLMPTDYLPTYSVNDTSTNMAPDLEAKLSTLAKAGPDYNSFVKVAVKIPGVGDDTKILNDVLDDGPEGFYAQHKG